MQEHIAKHLRISILIWLFLLTLTFPYLIAYYEQQQEFLWQEMVQPHWEAENNSVPLATAKQDVVGDNVLKGNTVELVVVEPVAPAPAISESVVIEQEPEATVPEKPSAPKVKENGKQKIIQKADRKAAAKKNGKLALKLPDNLYQGEVAEWEEKKPVVIPDLFAPKREPERVQLGGRLIMDEEPKKKQNQTQKEEDASYLDLLQGAEVNISIKVP